MEPARNDDSRALQEVSLNQIHNLSHYQGPSGGLIAPHGARGARHGLNDHDGIGRHLDDHADGDMMSDELMNEDPTACGLGGGVHGHTKSLQMSTSYVSGVPASRQLNRKHSKGKMQTASYQSSHQSRAGTQGARRSLVGPKPKSSASHTRASGASTGNATNRSNAGQHPTAHMPVARQANAQNSHLASQNSLQKFHNNRAAPMQTQRPPLQLGQHEGADVHMHNGQVTALISQRSNTQKAAYATGACKKPAGDLTRTNQERMQTRSQSGVANGDEGVGSRNNGLPTIPRNGRQPSLHLEEVKQSSVVGVSAVEHLGAQQQPYQSTTTRGMMPAPGLINTQEVRHGGPARGMESLTARITNEDLLAGNCMNGASHPSRKLSRQSTTDEQRQNRNVRHELSEDIDRYLRWFEETINVEDCLGRHKVTPALRARMVDWMIEVLTNFRCDDQTFFLSVSLMDRYFKNCQGRKEVSDLHVVGVTAMFIGSKFEDIYPLKMKTVFEKIAHKKLEIQRIKDLELDILSSIQYKIHAPTVLDFLKVYLADVLNIEILNRTETKKKEDLALLANNASAPEGAADAQPQDEQKNENQDGNETANEQRAKAAAEDHRTPAEKEAQLQKYLIEKMAIYLAKMSMHDMTLAERNPSLLAVGSIYVSLKICEQLKRKDLINSHVVERLIMVSRMGEDLILDVSQKVLHLAQNFDKEFPGLENLKKTHFGIITQLL